MDSRPSLTSAPPCSMHLRTLTSTRRASGWAICPATWIVSRPFPNRPSLNSVQPLGGSTPMSSGGTPQVQADAPPDQECTRLVRPVPPGEPNALCALAFMPWQRPDIGSRMNREVHVRFWERLGVKVPRATRQSRLLIDVHSWSARPPIVSVKADVGDFQRRARSCCEQVQPEPALGGGHNLAGSLQVVSPREGNWRSMDLRWTFAWAVGGCMPCYLDRSERRGRIHGRR